MPIPLIVGGIVAAASSLGSAKIQSNAAKNAAKEQQKGTDRALQVQQQAHQPYMDLGRAAAGRLGALASNPQPYTQQFTPGGGPPSQGVQSFNPSPGGGSLAGLGQPQQGAGGPQPPQMGRPGMVTLQAPTGETVRLPDGPQVHMAIQRGARRLA